MTDNPFDRLINPEFRWPKAGDRLFTRSPERDGNAHIDEHRHDRLVMMLTGYKRGADLMVERATQDPFDRDALVFPIIFNYRQFIELSLKYLIASYGYTVNVDAIWDTHSLDELWKAFKAVLQGYGHTDQDGSDTIVAGIVAEFTKVDPRSFSYRYPVDTKGKPIPVAHEELDLAVLAEVMEGLDSYFSGCDGYLDDLQRASQ